VVVVDILKLKLVDGVVSLLAVVVTGFEKVKPIDGVVSLLVVVVFVKLNPVDGIESLLVAVVVVVVGVDVVKLKIGKDEFVVAVGGRI